jgi:hypothetical protein
MASGETTTKVKSGALAMNFKSIEQLDVPKGRDGKHKQIVTQLLSAARQRGLDVSTSSDAEHLYVWKTETNS